ncbi:MAG: hypothetical protein ABI212_00120 [Burkholderiaceae bacterium]
MTDEIGNLLLEHMKRFQAELAASRERDKEILSRLANLEVGQGSILQHIGHLASALAVQQIKVDRLSDRIERIEQRLELAS